MCTELIPRQHRHSCRQFASEAPAVPRHLGGSARTRETQVGAQGGDRDQVRLAGEHQPPWWPRRIPEEPALMVAGCRRRAGQSGGPWGYRLGCSLGAGGRCQGTSPGPRGGRRGPSPSRCCVGRGLGRASSGRGLTASHLSAPAWGTVGPQRAAPGAPGLFSRRGPSPQGPQRNRGPATGRTLCLAGLCVDSAAWAAPRSPGLTLRHADAGARPSPEPVPGRGSLVQCGLGEAPRTGHSAARKWKHLALGWRHACTLR